MNSVRIVAVVALLGLTGSLGLAAESGKDKPNILLILVDDMGYGDLSCYGSRQISTPNIDLLAQGGVRFTQSYVTFSVCAPSRAGLLTGRSQNRFGFEYNLVGGTPFVNPDTKGLPTEEITVAERLRATGYATHIIGKWHQAEFSQPSSCGWNPLDHGFDTFFGMIQGHHHYFPDAKNCALMRDRERVDGAKPRVPYLTDWFTLETLDLIKAAAAKDSAQTKPWFIYLAYNTPHTPLEARDDDLQRFAHIKDEKRRTYLAMQYRLDLCVGQIIATLKELGQFEDTLIVFTNDNGGPTGANASVNAPLRGTKGGLLEGGIRVPMMIHWPTHLPGGATYTEPVSTMDLLPTFVAAAGGDWSDFTPKAKQKQAKQKKLPIYDGVNLLPYLTDKATGRPHQQLFWGAHFLGAVMRDGDLKLIRLPDRSAELYDLAQDIGETRNIAAEHPDKVRQMLEDLWAWECSFECAPRWSVSQRWPRRSFKPQYDLQRPQTQPAAE